MIPRIEYEGTRMDFVGFLPDYTKAVFQELSSSGQPYIIEPLIFHRAKKLFNNTDMEDCSKPRFILDRLENIEFLRLVGK